MALKRNDRYPGRFLTPTTDHPQGAFKNRTAPGANDGSYLEADWANDWDGFFARLLTVAGATANGSVDTAQSSQYYDALVAAMKSALGTAAQRNVGTGTNQLPDMNSFTVSENPSLGWYVLPNGHIHQYGYVTLPAVSNFNPATVGGITYYTQVYRVNFPRTYPNNQITTVVSLAGSNYNGPQANEYGTWIRSNRGGTATEVSKGTFDVSVTTNTLGLVPVIHFISEGN